MKITMRAFLLLLIALSALQAQTALPKDVSIEPFYDVTKPGLSFKSDKLCVMGMEEVPGKPQHFLVLGYFGYIWALYPDTTKEDYDPHGENDYTRTQLADFNEKVMKGWEQGAMSGAFDPNFRENHYFYFSYQTYPDPSKYTKGKKPGPHDGFQKPGLTVLERWILHPPDYLKITFDKTLLVADHGVGWGTQYITFGKDNNLWLSWDSYSKNGWDLSILHRKILRIDVSKPENGKLYSIPPDNPFVNNPDPKIKKEIWSYGHRNLWSLFANYLTGTMWGPEIGNTLWEELNLLNVPGGNYGWADGGDGATKAGHKGWYKVGVGTEGPCSEMTSNGNAYNFKGLQKPYSWKGSESNGETIDCSKLVNGTWNFHHGGKDYGGSKTALPGVKMNSILVGPVFRGDPSSAFYGYHFISDTYRNYFLAAKEGKEELVNVSKGPNADSDPLQNLVVTLKNGNTQKITFSGDRGHNGIVAFSEDSYGHHYAILASSSKRGPFAYHDIYRITSSEMKPLAKPRYSVHPMVGCMDPKACNFDKDAYVDDKESCVYTGCVVDPSGVQHRVDIPGIAISPKKVSVDTRGPHSVEIHNVNGKLVFSQRKNGPGDYSLSGFKTGIYLVKVTTPRVIKTERILLY